MNQEESVEGYVIDIACLRKYPQRDLLEKVRQHSKQCSLMGHCIESGFALVNESGRTSLLDTAATPLVINAVSGSTADAGIRLCAKRKLVDEEMHTFSVSEI